MLVEAVDQALGDRGLGGGRLHPHRAQQRLRCPARPPPGRRRRRTGPSRPTVGPAPRTPGSASATCRGRSGTRRRPGARARRSRSARARRPTASPRTAGVSISPNATRAGDTSRPTLGAMAISSANDNAETSSGECDCTLPSASKNRASGWPASCSETARGDRRLPLPRRHRRRPHRAVGHRGPSRPLPRPRRAGGHRRAPSCSRRSTPTTRSPTGRSRASSPAPAAGCTASRSSIRPAMRAAWRRSSARRSSAHGFRGIKVHRHDARITREICEAARRVRACRCSTTRWARSSPSSCSPASTPTCRSSSRTSAASPTSGARRSR